jgi:hypothetical protein
MWRSYCYRHKVLLAAASRCSLRGPIPDSKHIIQRLSLLQSREGCVANALWGADSTTGD